MEKQEHVTEPNQRVRLKPDGQDALYTKACAGSEGWVRRQKVDDLGYPMVWIEWDKDHWTYNGEPDRWAMEAHFDPIQEAKMSEQDSSEDFANFQRFQEFLRWQENQVSGQDKPVEKEPEPKQAEETVEEEFDQAIDAAIASSRASDAFILIGISREEREDQSLPKLTPFVIMAAKTPASSMLANLQLGHLASVALENLTVDAIQRSFNEDGQ